VLADEREGIMKPVHETSEADGDASRTNVDNTQIATLLAELSPDTDLARLVERVSRTGLLRVVVPGTALAAWEKRDPSGWTKVTEWLAAKGVTIVRV
jgi:hypothetical protein